MKIRVYGINAAVNTDIKIDIYKLLYDMHKVLNDDLNTSVALSLIDEIISLSNEELNNNPKNKLFKQHVVKVLNYIEDILGIGFNDAYEYFQFGIDEQTKSKIEELIEKRNEAKKEKDFATADTVREELSKMGISLMDTVNGTVWEKL